MCAEKKSKNRNIDERIKKIAKRLDENMKAFVKQRNQDYIRNMYIEEALKKYNASLYETDYDELEKYAGIDAINAVKVCLGDLQGCDCSTHNLFQLKKLLQSDTAIKDNLQLV